MRPGTSTELNELLTTVQHDTWTGISSIAISPPPASALANVVMAFKNDPTATNPTLELKSADGEIAITNAANWTFTVLPTILNLEAGTWYWQIQTTSSADVIVTYLQGEIEVLTDYTETP